MRFSYGGDLGNLHVGYGDAAATSDGSLAGRYVVALGGVDVTFWNAQTGGTQYTDLQDATGVPVDAVRTSQGTSSYPLGVMPQFFGPDNVPVMWAQPGAAPRLRITAVDAYNYAADQLSSIGALNTSLTALDGRMTTLEVSDAAAITALNSYSARVSTLETLRNLPVAELRPTAATTLPYQTWTSILFAGEAVDTDQDSVGGHSTTGNTSKFIVRYKGYYLVAGSITYVANTVGSRYARWVVNGVARPSVSAIIGYNATAGAVTVQANTMVLSLNLGDEVEMQGYHNARDASNNTISLATYSATGEFQPHLSVVYLRAN